MQALGLVWDGVDSLGADAHETRVAIPEPVHSGARLLYSHWRSRQASGGLVMNRDVPSRALASILRNLVVYEPIADCRDFRARIAGSALIRRFDCDITGLKLSELFDSGTFDMHRKMMKAVLETDTPSALDVRLAARGRTQLHFEVLCLPVHAPDRKRPWALVGLFYYDWEQ